MLVTLRQRLGVPALDERVHQTRSDVVQFELLAHVGRCTSPSMSVTRLPAAAIARARPLATRVLPSPEIALVTSTTRMS